MHTAAITSHAAFMVSPRLSATVPNEIVPRAITAAHSSFVCIPAGLAATSLILSSLKPAAIRGADAAPGEPTPDNLAIRGCVDRAGFRRMNSNANPTPIAGKPESAVGMVRATLLLPPALQNPYPRDHVMASGNTIGCSKFGVDFHFRRSDR